MEGRLRKSGIYSNVSLIKAYCRARHGASGRVRRKTFQFAPIAPKLESLCYRGRKVDLLFSIIVRLKAEKSKSTTGTDISRRKTDETGTTCTGRVPSRDDRHPKKTKSKEKNAPAIKRLQARLEKMRRCVSDIKGFKHLYPARSDEQKNSSIGPRLLRRMPATVHIVGTRRVRARRKRFTTLTTRHCLMKRIRNPSRRTTLHTTCRTRITIS